MRRRLGFRPVGGIVALGTVIATAATVAVALPSDAAAAGGTREYAASFNAPCIIGPGILNIKSEFAVSVSAIGPSSVTPGEEFSFTGAKATITAPAETSEAFVTIGAVSVKGTVTRFVLDTTNLLPAEINIAESVEYPAGLPFAALDETGKATVLQVPSLTAGETGKSFSFGPFKVTGKAGEDIGVRVDDSAGFVEEEGSYKATGKGIVASVSGFNVKGEKVLGPLAVDCTAPPPGVGLMAAPIEGATTTTTTTTTPTTSTTTTTISSTTTTTATATVSGEPEILPVTFKNWILSGSLADKKLGEKITLPSGSTFNGSALIPGTLEGNTSVPPFKAAIKIFGLLPTTLGLTFTENGPAKATITPSGANLAIKGTAKDSIGFTAVDLLGLNIPVSCKTAEAVTFPLEATLPASDLATGATFTGTTTLPKVNCSGGLLGALFGPVISELMSGPGNAFSLTIAP